MNDTNVYIANEYSNKFCDIALLNDIKPHSSPFKTSTIKLINFCNKNNQNNYNIMSLSNKFAFKKRRIYEVIDVFTVIGVTVLLDEENFLWVGFNHVSQTIQRICTNRGVYSSDLTLNDIFCLSQEPISIQSMTEDIIVLFIAIERRRLNIIEASKYISHGNGKEKTTRCKIYQAVAILELANIIRKTENQSEYELMPEFYITVPKVLKNSTIDPSNIQSLLNWTDDSNDFSSDIISLRRKEFYTISHE